MTASQRSWRRIGAFVCVAVAQALVALGAGHAAEPGGAKRPNILIAIADDWSYGHAGAYGCGWVKTPAFDRVAREGVLFKNGFHQQSQVQPVPGEPSDRAEHLAA